MVKPGPTLPKSFGPSALALPAIASAASGRMEARARARRDMPQIRDPSRIGLEERALGAQFGAEALAQRLDDALAQAGGVFVGERPLGRAELEMQRHRLAPLPHLLAAVHVEDPRGVQLWPGRLARRAHERPG